MPVVDIGLISNDGTGDPLRAAFIAANTALESYGQPSDLIDVGAVADDGTGDALADAGLDVTEALQEITGSDYFICYACSGQGIDFVRDGLRKAFGTVNSVFDDLETNVILSGDWDDAKIWSDDLPWNDGAA